MRVAPRLLSLMTLFALLGSSHKASSDENDPIVVSVGARALPLSSLANRLDGLAPFQRRAFGASPSAQGKRYLEQVLIPDLLLAEHGRTAIEPTSPRRRAKENALLRQALTARIKQQVTEQSPVTEVEVRGYYDAHPELFVEKERIRLQRLLVGSESEAQALIQKAKGFATMDDWRNLVREKSLDKATSERGGELGFVADDGSTEVPELEVDPALFAAAQKAKDGELLAAPVAEGQRFSVVWRRGSRPAKTVDYTKETPRIRQYLLEARVEQQLAQTVARLRKAQLHAHRPHLLEPQDFSKILERGFSR